MLKPCPYEPGEKIPEGEPVILYVMSDENHWVILEIEMTFVDRPGPHTVVLRRMNQTDGEITTFQFDVGEVDRFDWSDHGYFADHEKEGGRRHPLPSASR